MTVKRRKGCNSVDLPVLRYHLHVSLPIARHLPKSLKISKMHLIVHCLKKENLYL